MKHQNIYFQVEQVPIEGQKNRRLVSNHISRHFRLLQPVLLVLLSHAGGPQRHVNCSVHKTNYFEGRGPRELNNTFGNFRRDVLKIKTYQTIDQI